MGWLSLKRITGSQGVNLGGAAKSIEREVIRPIGGGVESVVNTVGNAVADVGRKVDDLVAEIPGGWATVISIANPALAPVAAGTKTLVDGGSLEDALKSAVIAYGLQIVGGEIVDSTSSSVTPEMIAAANATSDPVAALAAQTGWTTVDPTYLAQIGYSSAAAGAATQPSEDIFKDTTAPDTDFKADYSLESAVKGTASPEGLQGTLATTPLPTPGTPVDYSLAIKEEMLGLKPFTIPSLASMGGGQGLVIPVEEGFMTSSGLIPYDSIMDIGDPNSFINNGKVDKSALQQRIEKEIQGTLLNKALKGILGTAATGAFSQPEPAESIPAFAPPDTMPVYDDAYFQAVQQNYNALAPQGLMADVATPLREWYVVDRLFGDKL